MAKKKVGKLVDYEESLLKELQDPEEAIEYLNAALMDEDPRVFLLAIKHVLEAQQQKMSVVAKKSNLNRENLYRMLSKRGNPRLTSIVPMLNALGLHLTVQANKNK